MTYPAVRRFIVVPLLHLLLCCRVLAAQTPVADPPVEQIKKNIQVLTGLPGSQLIPVMTVMSNSLGVRCTFCHGEEWESDEKSEKRLARKMIEMVRRINDQSFGGEPVVGCNSCHHGTTHPDATPDLENAAWKKARTVAPAALPVPPPSEVFTRYASALGDVAAWEGAKSRTALGVITRDNGRGEPSSALFTLVQEKGAAGKLTTELRHPPDADAGLTIPLQYGPLLEQRYRFTRKVGTETVGGRSAWVLEGVPKDGSRSERLYFDAATGLLLRLYRTSPTPVGPLPERFDYTSWRQAAGVQLPFVTTWSRGDSEVTFALYDVKQEQDR